MSSEQDEAAMAIIMLPLAVVLLTPLSIVAEAYHKPPRSSYEVRLPEKHDSHVRCYNQHLSWSHLYGREIRCRPSPNFVDGQPKEKADD